MTDLHLHATAHGDGYPLLLLHGFTSAGAAWSDHIHALAQRCRVITPDLLGHGSSPAPTDPARYDMSHCVADLVALLDRQQIESVHCLGYSMGGRVALALALSHPRRLRSLILESASPGIADPDERHRRYRRDCALAARIESDGVAAFVEEWMRQPLFASQHSLPEATRAARRELRLANTARGLANSLRGLGSGAQPSYWNDLATLGVPTLLISGARDEKFRHIAERMARLIGAAKLVVIPGAGHTTHLEQPAQFGRAVRSFIEEIQVSSPQTRSDAENSPRIRSTRDLAERP